MKCRFCLILEIYKIKNFSRDLSIASVIGRFPSLAYPLWRDSTVSTFLRFIIQPVLFFNKTYCTHYTVCLRDANCIILVFVCFGFALICWICWVGNFILLSPVLDLAFVYIDWLNFTILLLLKRWIFKQLIK